MGIDSSNKSTTPAAEAAAATAEGMAEFDQAVGAVASLDNSPSGRLLAIERELQGTFLDRDPVIRGLLTGLIARHHGVILGPPGEAKSALVDDIRRRITGATGFKLLMTRLTVPEEVFGPVSISALKQDRYRRMTGGYVSEAHIPFLDEPFKAGSSILNTLLQLLNEREFRNDGEVTTAPLISLFGASNEMPQGEDLGALWDRMLLRFWVDPLRGANLRRFLAMKRDAMRALTGSAADAPEGAVASAMTITLEELFGLQAQAQRALGQLSDHVFELYEAILRELQSKGYKLPSTRRTGWCMQLVAAHATLCGRAKPNETDLGILGHALWDSVKEAREVQTIVLKAANPRLADAQVKIATVFDVAAQAEEYWNANPPHNRSERIAKIVEARTKISELGAQLRKLANDAREDGEDTTQIEALVVQARESYGAVTMLAGIDQAHW